MIKSLIRKIGSLYRDFFILVWQHRTMILVMFIVLILGLIFGIVMPGESKASIVSLFSEKFGGIAGGNTAETLDFAFVIALFFNNIIAGGIMYITGLLLVIPLFSIFYNGVTVGAIMSLSFRQLGATMGTVGLLFAAILPHGIIEIPLLLTCAALGTASGLKLLVSSHYHPTYTRKKYFALMAWGLIWVMLPLFFVAATIEIYITPRIIVAIQQYQDDHKIEDASLTRLIPTTEDFLLKNIAAKQLSEDESIQPENAMVSDNDASFLYLKVLDDNYYALLKEMRTRPSFGGYYSLDGKTISVVIRSFDDATQALSMADRLQLQFASTPIVRVGRVNNIVYIITGDQKPTYDMQQALSEKIIVVQTK